MPVLNLPGTGNAKPAVELDKRVEFQVNKNVNENQKRSGVVAKVQVRHPAFTVVATVWTKNGRKYVTFPQQASSKGGTWYTLVNTDKDVKDHILYLVEHSEEDNSAWYIDMLGEYTTKITDEVSNPDLGIVEIIPDANLTDKQTDSGMLCKVNIVTTIGTIYSYTIWRSKFGNSLFGTSPLEGGVADDGTRGNTAYRLSREATAQVLSYLHKYMDWATPDVIRERPAPAATTASDVPAEPAFEAVDEDEVLVD